MTTQARNVVTTIHGQMDERLLEKVECRSADGAFVTEYYLHKTLVHRSAVVGLTGVSATGIAKL